jgi:hypothetical protein
MAKAALGRKVTATINGVKRKMTVQDVSFRRLADKAMSGDQKAFNFLLTLANKFGPSDIGSAHIVTAEQDLDIIADYVKRNPRRSGSK